MARKPERADSQAALTHPEDRRDAIAPRPGRNRIRRAGLLGTLFGEFDANLVRSKTASASISARAATSIMIEGSEDDVARARDVLKAMHQRLLTGQELDSRGGRSADRDVGRADARRHHHRRRRRPRRS